MKRIMSMVVIMICILSVSCFAEETDPGEILKMVRDTYRSMETYRSEGTRTLNQERDNQKSEMVTSYSILLKKTNLYHISSEMTFSLSPTNKVVGGTIWNDGTQPYKCESGTKSYSELPNDIKAIGEAGAMSSPIVVFAFFSSTLEDLGDFLDQLKNVKLEGVEKIRDEECYIISADSKMDTKETFWISKARSLIVKHTSSFEGQLMPEMTDEQAAKMLKTIGQEVNDETIKQFKEEMQPGPSNVKSFLTEIQTQISSPELTAADFQFALPEGAVLE